MSRLIIASAASFEVSPLVSALQTDGRRFTHISTGIGLTESAIVAARLRELIVGRDVVFCCTGGVIGAFKNPVVYQVKGLSLSPLDARNGDAYLLNKHEPTYTLAGDVPVIPVCDVVGSLGVSVGRDHTMPTNVTLETIELYGVYKAWHAHVRTFTAIIASTNATGPNAHAEWSVNFKQAAELTARELLPEISRRFAGEKGTQR